MRDAASAHPKRNAAAKHALRLCAIAACAAAFGAAQAAKPARTIDKDDIPAGFAVGSGQPALALDVVIENGRVARAGVATAADAANVTASANAKEGETTLTIKHGLKATLKFDLYISADGERFVYASSCAVTPGISSFEMWQQPIRAFALGNPRVVDDVGCD